MVRITVLLSALLLLGTVLQPFAPASEASQSPVASRETYHTYATMVQELQALQSNHPDLVALENIGKTYEGRDIWAVKLSDDVATNDTSEPDVLIFGGTHAREVMGVEVPLFVLNYMIDNYGMNETLSKYINTKETWFVPMLNPDGHVYIETPGNDWRGNRRPTTGGNIGVDLNRNWGFMFGVDGATSDDPASQVYHGPYPFSENETIALRDLALRQRFATTLSFHSVASLILFPWGYTTAHCPDHDELSAMAAQLASWNGYTPEQSSQLYPTHGCSEDWFYANTSAKAFTIELDTAFHPPESQIPISCALNREPVLYLIGYPNATITDAGIFALPAPFNGSLIEPDRELKISARVMNYGTSEAGIPVELEIASGPYIFTNSSSLRLRPGQTGLWNSSWYPPLTIGENCTLRVRTNLSGDEWSWNDLKSAGFRIKAKYGVALTNLTETTQGCFPGLNVSYPLQLRSLGNREDDILLELIGARAGWASLPGPVHLPPAGERELDLRVSVPRDASPGEAALISVRAYSSTGQGAAGALTTRTTVLDPAPAAEAGEDITVNVTVEVELNGSRSTTPTGKLVNLTWDFGDGSSSEGAIVRHAYLKRGFYVVNLTVTNELGFQGMDSLNVTVLQDFRLDLSAESRSVLLRPGETLGVNLTLANLGNGFDTVDLVLDALKWNASLDTREVALAAGEARSIGLCITAPERALAGATALFRATAVSRESPYTSDEVIVTAVVREVRELAFSIDDSSRSVDAGESTVFTAAFRNGGNIDENVSLSASGLPEGWTARFSRTNVTVAPWSNATVAITVSSPPGVLAGLYTVVVNGWQLNITIKERYGFEAAVEVPAAEVLPGQEAFFNLTVENDCNCPATIAVLVGGLPPNWTVSGQCGVELEVGGNRTVRIGIRAPAGASPAIYPLKLEISVAADPNVTKTIPIQVKVLEVKKAEPTTLESSLMFIVLLLVIILIAAVAGAAIYSRRRKGLSPPPESERVLDESEALLPGRTAQIPPQPYSRSAGLAPPPAGLASPRAASQAPAYQYQQENIPVAAPAEASAGEEILVAEAVPLEGAPGQGAPTAAPFPATAYESQEAPAPGYDSGMAIPPATSPSEPLTCLWCFKQMVRGEPRRECTGCGAPLHRDCAAAAGRCPRCGGLL